MEDERNVGEPTTQEYVVKNRLQATDGPIHGWYRFILGYPPHLVREYLDIFQCDPEKDWIFDPFCGTATTPVEARLLGFPTMSTDANPISVLAAKVKLNWDLDLNQITSLLGDILDLAARCLSRYDLASIPNENLQLSLFGSNLLSGRVKYGNGGNELTSEFQPNRILLPASASLIPTGFISEKPLLRVLAMRYAIENIMSEQNQCDFFKLALANTIVKSAGNVGFGPEVYRLPPKEDADVLGEFSLMVYRMVDDLRMVIEKQALPYPPAYMFSDDARTLSRLKETLSIGAVITSPPYPNEKDYTRTTRLESVLLGLINTKSDLRTLKNNLLRSNTRNVFISDDDDRFIKDIPSVLSVADEIERKRVELGKTSGFERLYHRVTRLYFGGMYRHLKSLIVFLRPGAHCAYVVGDQMSYFRVHIRTASLLADVAIKAGYEVEGIQLWRTRRSTATKLDLEENVLILKRPG